RPHLAGDLLPPRDRPLARISARHRARIRASLNPRLALLAQPYHLARPPRTATRSRTRTGREGVVFETPSTFILSSRCAAERYYGRGEESRPTRYCALSRTSQLDSSASPMRSLFADDTSPPTTRPT